MLNSLIRVKQLLGFDNEKQQDPFGAPTKSSLKFKVVVGAGLIAGLSIVALAIATSAFSSPQQMTEIPVELSVTGETNAPVIHTEGGLWVHVIGEVQHPGIYHITDRPRVVDAVMAAGGFTSNAAECAVNLAREIRDGEQLNIPSLNEGCSVSGEKSSPGHISLNQATTEQLDSLPGIGPTLAERIVQWRQTNGGFASVDQLNDVAGIGDKLFNGVKELITL